MIYLDAASTAKYTNIDDIIVETMTNAMKDSWTNPSSLYASNVKKKIDECRENIAKFINAKPDEIIFTSGASESNSMAIKGWVEQTDFDNREKDTLDVNLPYIFTTPIEHKSILSVLDSSELLCFRHMCMVDNDGVVILDSLERLLKTYEGDDILVTIHMANNEIGTIQPIKKISELVHKYGGVLHVDATQALSHIPIDVEALGIDMLSASGHKISPVLRGIGFLYKRNGINIKPLIYGAQENGLRGGTENTYGIIGLSKALEYCDVGFEAIGKVRDKSSYFIAMLKSKFGCKVNGSENMRLPNNVNVTFQQNISGENLLYLLDMADIKVSVSSACNSHEIKQSHVLTVIGLSEEEAMRTVRFTLPSDITYDELNTVVDEIGKALKILELNSNGDE